MSLTLTATNESPEPLPGPFTATQFTDDELAELNVEFEQLPASKIVQWATDNFGPLMGLAASMTDSVLIDLAVKVAPAIEVVFIDTGYHFPETLETVEVVRRRYGLNRLVLVEAFETIDEAIAREKAMKA